MVKYQVLRCFWEQCIESHTCDGCWRLVWSRLHQANSGVRSHILPLNYVDVSSTMSKVCDCDNRQSTLSTSWATHSSDTNEETCHCRHCDSRLLVSGPRKACKVFQMHRRRSSSQTTADRLHRTSLLAALYKVYTHTIPFIQCWRSSLLPNFVLGAIVAIFFTIKKYD